MGATATFGQLDNNTSFNPQQLSDNRSGRDGWGAGGGGGYQALRCPRRAVREFRGPGGLGLDEGLVEEAVALEGQVPLGLLHLLLVCRRRPGHGGGGRGGNGANMNGGKFSVIQPAGGGVML